MTHLYNIYLIKADTMQYLYQGVYYNQGDYFKLIRALLWYSDKLMQKDKVKLKLN